MKAIGIIPPLILLLSSCTLLSPSSRPIPHELIGHWSGKGRIIVTWCMVKTLRFDLIVDKDGSVSGKIGDSTIRHGNLDQRCYLMTMFGNGKYIIDAGLEGAIIRSEQIERNSIRMLLNLKNHCLIGEANTSGMKFGGKEKMYLKIVDIVLIHSS